MEQLDPVVDTVPDDAVLADVRWYLDGRRGRDAYEAGHLPHAVFVDLEEVLAARDRPATEGRHPFPDPTEFAVALGALGIGDDTPVVAYDDTGGMTAGRLVVMLRMLGHAAAVLDGGLAAHAGGGLETGPGPTLGRRRFTPRPWPTNRLADIGRVAEVAASPDGRAIDARSYERFTGAVTQVDPRPGHIPGARSAPWSDVIDPDTIRFRPPHELFEHYRALGIDEQTDVVAYCGSGVSACVNVLAMERAGFPPPRLYVASFSGWSADPERPTELGG